MTNPDIYFSAPLASNFHRRETGIGVLHASNGSEVGCRFVVEQITSGSITLRCLLDTAQSEEWRKRPFANELHNKHADLTFDLETDSGYQLENLCFHPGGGGVTVNGLTQSLEFDLSFVDLHRTRTPRFERPIAFAQFSIVNFEIDGGNACVRLSEIWRWNNNVIALKLGDRECWLHAVKNADDIIKELKATKGIDVTATVMLPLHSLDECDAIQDRVDDLCTVLTLLSGNRVTWISTRAIDSYGYPLRERWRDSVTNPYTKDNLANMLTDKPFHVQVETITFVPIIERMVSCFEEAEQKWNIRAVINTWHETVISDHFPEQRGMLVAACMEMLRASYLKQGGRETIIDATAFEDKRNAVGKELKKILKVLFPAEELWDNEKTKAHYQDLSLMYSHVKSLNHFPFGQSLEQMAHELNMTTFDVADPKNCLSFQLLETISADEDQIKNSIKCFVSIRDNLIHQGAFVLNAEDRQDDQNDSAGQQRMVQLEFLQRFAAAFLCSTLGWTQPLPAALNLPR